MRNLYFKKYYFQNVWSFTYICMHLTLRLILFQLKINNFILEIKYLDYSFNNFHLRDRNTEVGDTSKFSYFCIKNLI